MGHHVYYSGEVSISPPLSEEDAAVVYVFLNLEPSEETQPIFAAIAASEEPDLPWFAGFARCLRGQGFPCPRGRREPSRSASLAQAVGRTFPGTKGIRLERGGSLGRRGFRRRWLHLREGQIASRPST